MMMTRLLQVGLVVGMALLSSGCLFSTSEEKIVESEAERVAVNFENEEALRTFQHEVDCRYDRGAAKQGESSFFIPFVVATSTTSVLSENAYYNRQIARADVNRDGVITEIESKTYAKVK